MTHTTYWTVPLDHPAFAGHFPGTPILPGVVLLDTALQAIASANPRNWDAPYNDTATFQQWAQNRARAAIAKATGSAA